MDQTLGNTVAEIHRLHLQLRETQEQMERGPRLLKARQQATAQKQADLEAQKQKHKGLRVTADQKSLQLKSNEAKIADLRAKLNQASSNREFDIIRTQIDADTMANSVLEDEILDTLEKVDAAQIGVKQLEEAVVAAKAEEARIAAETDKTLPGLQTQVAELTTALTAAESKLPADFLLQYRRLAQAYGAGALAEVDGSICGSCYVSLPPQMAVQVRAGHVVFCKTCGRLVYAKRDAT
jgi:predicted  nucleic acid-binding Zn-ribbon protein